MSKITIIVYVVLSVVALLSGATIFVLIVSNGSQANYYHGNTDQQVTIRNEREQIEVNGNITSKM